MGRLGIIGADGQGRYGPFQAHPDPGPPPDPDPEEPPPDPEDPPPDPPEPGDLAHGSDVTASNTGFVGLGLTSGQLVTSGSITSDHDGQVIYGKRINGIVRINHDNVEVRGCEINAPLGSHAIQYSTSAGASKIFYTRIHQSTTSGGDRNGVSGIYHSPAGKGRHLVYRCHITDVSDGAKASGGWEFRECFIDIPTQLGSTHNDGIQSQKSSPNYNPSVIIRRCKIRMGPNFGNAAIFITGEGGSQYNVLIEDNWLQCSVKSHCVAVHGQDNIGSWLGTITIDGNKCVVGWNSGPESFFSLIEVPGSQVVRTNNRRVNEAGTDLGPV